MNARKALISVLQLFAGFSFFTAALFFLSLPFLPKVRLHISDVLISSPKICTPIGTALMAAAFLLIGAFYALNRGRNLTIGMGTRKATINPTVIHKMLEECFKTHFDGQIVLSEIGVIRGSKLEIEVCLIPFEENLREDLFAAVQSQIRPLLEERLGYSKSFYLIVKSN